MHISIKCDAEKVQKLLDSKAREAPIVIQKAVVDGTTQVLRTAREELSAQVYNKPIPKRKKSGKPAWKRSGNLIRQERMHFPRRFEGVVDNRAPYAHRRHELNKPSPVDGVVRRAPWRKTARDKSAPVVQKIFDNAIKALTD